jgi:uncharacterized RDD family membrane protein YckC
MSAPGITVLKNNVPWGPFTRAQIDDGLRRGDFTRQTLAHASGRTEWQPLGDVLDDLDRNERLGAPSLPPVPGPRDLPPVPEPVAPIPVAVATPPPLRPPILPASTPTPPQPVLSPVVEKREFKPEPRPAVPLKPATIFQRGFAFLIDCAILFVPLAMLFLLCALAIELPAAWHHIPHEQRMQEWALLEQNTRRIFWLIFVGLGWFYVAGLECSSSQATIGKRWMGVKVTDANGERMSFLRSSCRYAAKYLSALPCFLGFIMPIFSSRGLALHDRLTDTRAVRD